MTRRREDTGEGERRPVGHAHERRRPQDERTFGQEQPQPGLWSDAHSRDAGEPPSAHAGCQGPGAGPPRGSRPVLAGRLHGVQADARATLDQGSHPRPVSPPSGQEGVRARPLCAPGVQKARRPSCEDGTRAASAPPGLMTSQDAGGAASGGEAEGACREVAVSCWGRTWDIVGQRLGRGHQSPGWTPSPAFPTESHGRRSPPE